MMKSKFAIIALIALFAASASYTQAASVNSNAQNQAQYSSASFPREIDTGAKVRIGDKRWNGLAWEYYTPGYWKLNALGKRVWVKPGWSYFWVPASTWREGHHEKDGKTFPGYWQAEKYHNYYWIAPRRNHDGSYRSGRLQRRIEYRDPRLYQRGDL